MRFRETNETLGSINTPEDGYRALSSAIIALACDDYLRALERKDTGAIKKLERFFLGEHFLLFSEGVQGEFLLKRLKDMRPSYENHTIAKPVQRLDCQGNVLEEYMSVADAAWSISGDRRSITRACESGGGCYGYFWKYAENGR